MNLGVGMDVSALTESDGLHELLVLNTQELGGFGGVETLGNLMQLAKCGQRGSMRSTSQRGQRNFSGFPWETHTTTYREGGWLH